MGTVPGTGGELQSARPRRRAPERSIPAMTNRTRASSGLPIVVVLLAVAAVAVYFGRDFLRAPEPARVAGPAPVEDPGAGNATAPAVAGAESGAPAGRTAGAEAGGATGSDAPSAVAGAEGGAPAGRTSASAEAVADRIVGKITDTSAEESAATAGDGSGTTESAGGTETAVAGVAPGADPTSSPGTLVETARIASGRNEARGDGAGATQDLSGRDDEAATAAGGVEQALLAAEEADSDRAPGPPDGEPVERVEADPGAAGATASATGTATVAKAGPEQGGTNAGSASMPAPGGAGSAPAVAGVPSGAAEEALIGEVAELVARKISEVSPPPAPIEVASAAAETAAELGLDGDRLAHAVTEAVVEEQAKSFVDTLVEAQAHPIDVSRADHFVPMEQVVSLLPETAFEVTTRNELLSDPEIGPHTPITVVRAVEQIEIADPAKVIASAGGDLDREIRILDGDEVRVETVRQVLRDFIDTSMETISILAEVKYFEITTPAEFAQHSELGPDEALTVVKDRYRLEAATVAELLREELDLPSDSIFYLRTVRAGDTQGIWGIVQDGLTGNFARGMAIRYGQSINTYQVEIPRDADELLANQSSSFLGRLIHEKTLQSYVYNFVRHRMGRNPHRIYPEQEIAIINFTPEELVSIYKHFVARHDASG